MFCVVLSVVVHRKENHPQAKPFQRAGGYWIGFLKFHPRAKSSLWAGGYWIGFFLHIVHPYEKSILPTQSRWLLRYSSMYISNEYKTTIFHIFQFYIRRTQQISLWTITAPRISHDDYQLSIKTTWYHKDDGIMETENTRRISHTMMIIYPRNSNDENDSRSWRWWYHGNRRFLRKKVYSKTSCVIFYIRSLVWYNKCKFHRI